MRDLVVFGAGGHGREALAVAAAINAVDPSWNLIGFLDDGEVDGARLDRLGLTVLAETEIDPTRTWYVIGIGSGRAREDIDQRMTGLGFSPASLQHPSAWRGPDVRLGPGTILAATAAITTNVEVGRHSHLNVAAIVSHDCVVGDSVTIGPGARVNGTCRIGDRTFIGAGATITPNTIVGNDVMIGAGAVVLDDVPTGVTVSGVPARPHRVSRSAATGGQASNRS